MNRRATAALVAVGAIAATMLSSSTACAQDGDQALAESLFQEGKRLLARREFPAACERLEDSKRLDPAGGTLFALAVCYEEEGRLASAWLAFGEAIAAARRDQRDDRDTLSREHRARLEPRLPLLQLRIVDGPPQLEIKVDATTLPRAAWTVPLPLDPGRHVVSLSAPGFRERAGDVMLAEGERTVLDLPPLDPIVVEPPKVVAPLATPPPATTIRWRRVLGWSFVGVGAGLTVFGAYAGLDAFSKKEEASGYCDAAGCDAAGLDLLRDGRASATRSTVAIGFGVAALAVGIVALVVEHGATGRIAFRDPLRF